MLRNPARIFSLKETIDHSDTFILWLYKNEGRINWFDSEEKKADHHEDGPGHEKPDIFPVVKITDAESKPPDQRKQGPKNIHSDTTEIADQKNRSDHNERDPPDKRPSRLFH